MFDTKYVAKCIESQDVWRGKGTYMGDWYLDNNKQTMDVVSSEKINDIIFSDKNYIYIPDLDDIMEFINLHIEARGIKASDKEVIIKYADGKWNASIKYGDDITYGNGDSMHEVLLGCVFQMMLINE
jgi:hypothetical protein